MITLYTVPAPLLQCARKRGSFWRRANTGYSLVEIAIVLTAISLVVTGAIWPFAQQWQTDRYNETHDYIKEGIHEAILAYAARTRSVTVPIRFTGPSGTVPVDYQSPSGRPVLPCPDLDGDGWEDRNKQINLDTTGNTPLVIALALANGTGNDKYAINLDKTLGRCLDQKGILPWRTLGVKPADPWGQHYTYWVDQNFSHGMFGFDQTTRASNMFKYLAVPVEDSGFSYVMHTLPIPSGDPPASSFARRINSDDFPSRAIYPSTGIVLYDTNTNTNPALQNFGANARFDENWRFVAGAVLRGSEDYYRSLTELRRINRHDGATAIIYEYNGLQLSLSSSNNSIANSKRPVMANGIAFAVLSHGKNGAGGRVYETSNSSDSFTCKEFSNVVAQARELSNARLTYSCTVRDLIPAGTCVVNAETSCLAGSVSNGIFFANPDTLANQNNNFDFDDVVTWMQPDDLAGKLTERGVLPQPPPPVAIIANLATATNTFFL